MSFNLQYKSYDNSEIFNVNLGNYLPTIQIKNAYKPRKARII